MILLLSSAVLLLGTVFLLGALPLSPERMEKRLRPVVWDGQEAALLSLAFDPEKTQSDLDAFLSGWDLGRDVYTYEKQNVTFNNNKYYVIEVDMKKQ